MASPPASARAAGPFFIPPGAAARPDFLVFRLDSERFAIAATTAQRVLAAVQVTPVPGAPEAVSGVVDVHGSLTPVFDLRRRFGRPAREIDPDDHFILAVAGGRRVLLHVDEVSEIVRLEDAELQGVSDVTPGTEYISGIARLPQGLVLIHDLATFLSGTESLELDAAIASLREGTESGS